MQRFINNKLTTGLNPGISEEEGVADFYEYFSNNVCVFISLCCGCCVSDGELMSTLHPVQCFSRV